MSTSLNQRFALARIFARLFVVIVGMMTVLRSQVFAQTSGANNSAAYLVRCVPRTDAACFSLQATAYNAADSAVRGDRGVVIAAPVISSTSLARTSWNGIAHVNTPSAPSQSIVFAWRPPYFALPAFFGAADSALVPVEVREALNAGTELTGVRPLIALVLSLMAAALWIFVPRLFWTGQSETDEDIARRAAYYRREASSQEILVLRGPAPKEGAPRRPSEPTMQTEIFKRPGS